MGENYKVHIGGDGIPFLTKRAAVPDYKTSSPFEKLPSMVRKTRVDVLDLSDEDQYKRYLMIWDAVGYGIATVIEEDKKFIESKENWKVFIRWCINGKMDQGELRSIQLDSATRLTEGGAGKIPGLTQQIQDKSEEWL